MACWMLAIIAHEEGFSRVGGVGSPGINHHDAAAHTMARAAQMSITKRKP